jgi:hypothetical protein
MLAVSLALTTVGCVALIIVLVLELESEIGPIRSAISGTAQTPPFDYEKEFEDDYELLWRL